MDKLYQHTYLKINIYIRKSAVSVGVLIKTGYHKYV